MWVEGQIWKSVIINHLGTHRFSHITQQIKIGESLHVTTALKIKCAQFDTVAEFNPFVTGRQTESEPATDVMHSSFTQTPPITPIPLPFPAPPPCHLEVLRTFQPCLLPDFLTAHPDWLSHRDCSVWICLWLMITQSTSTQLSWPWSAQRWTSRSPRVRKVWNPSYLLWSNFHMLSSAFFIPL